MPSKTVVSDVVVVRRAGDAADSTRAALRELSPWIDAGADVKACIAVGLSSAAFVSRDVIEATLAWLDESGIAHRVAIAVVPQADRDSGWDAARLSVRHGLPAGLLVDAWSRTEQTQIGDGHVLDGRHVSVAWRTADVRVLLAPCATDPIDGTRLSLDVLRYLPLLIAGADAPDVVTDLVQTMPPHVTLVDASVVSDGIAGSAVRHPVRADAIIASKSPLLADLVGARLVGVDPLRAPLLSAVAAVTGLPSDYRVDGDLTPLTGIVHPPESLLRSTRAASPTVQRVLAAAMTEEFEAAGDDTVMTFLRQQLRPAVEASTGTDVVASSLAWSASGTAAIASTIEAFRITFAKDSVARRVASLGLDLSRYAPHDYEEAESSLRPLLQLLDGLPADRDGLRWMHLDGAVVFEASRTVAAPYPMWIERVDVSAAISLMADYLGGSVVVVTRDKQSRPARQAERNIYLPQPNYTAFSGGQVIDVCKLSVMNYRADSCEIWWRTVRSPNGSAVYDDGTVCFEDAGDGFTRITIRGRQQFTLPPTLLALDLDLQPQLRDHLTEDAYRRFFTTTLDNFEAQYEGRDFAIGKEPDAELPTRGLSRLLKVTGQSVSDWFAMPQSTTSDPGRTSVDDRGFTHVAGSRR